MNRCEYNPKLLDEVITKITSSKTYKRQLARHTANPPTVENPGLINIPCAFDIETTSTEVQGQKFAFMYVWMLGLGHGSPIIFGRTWAEFQEAIHTIQERLHTSPTRRLPIFVHNLSYEFQFMRNYFEWFDVFSLKERKPVTATTTNGIEFRCSYLLSGSSLSTVAKNLLFPEHKHLAKLEGSLDYTKVRHHETPLTNEEVAYCEADIRIVTAYITEELNEYNQIERFPITNTGRVRRYVRANCFTGKDGKFSLGAKTRYKNFMNKLTLTEQDYRLAATTFQGGFTHASPIHSDMVLHNVSSVDFTSSYPSVMVAERFPMSRFEPVTVNQSEYEELVKEDMAIMTVAKFTNLRVKIEQEAYISHSKCQGIKNDVTYNGRVLHADELSIAITELDYKIIKVVYDFDNVKFAATKVAKKAYLPKKIVEAILKLYQDKTELKGVVGKEVEYLRSKGMLNSVYGMSVMAIDRPEIHYQENWKVNRRSLALTLNETNSDENRFLYYPWGIWITAYARYNLWTGIMSMGSDYVYSDTDSIKLLNYESHKSYFDAFNTAIVDKLELACQHIGADVSLIHPKTIKGQVKTLGVWDYEGTYPIFKTIGAKRYLQVEDNQLHITVAGLGKREGAAYLMKIANNDLDKAIDMFTDDLNIPAEYTGKSEHTYIDQELVFEVTDYLGNTVIVHALSGVHLQPTSFTLSRTESHLDILAEVQAGRSINNLVH